jgi:ParB/Sulfiredoxin domain
MSIKKRHNWEPPTWLKTPVASIARFHDEEVEVYEGTCAVENIRLWHGNYRTLLDFAHLAELTGKTKTGKITEPEFIEYIIGQGLHNIPDLADSIKVNGVRVPLIVSYAQELLDGNRRLLACKYLLSGGGEQLSTFLIVPVKCTAPRIGESLKLKIIAEMNFLPDYKEPWPREVRAAFAIQQFQDALAKFKDENKAYQHVEYFLQLKKADVKRFQAVLAMLQEYADYAEREGKKARQEAERFGRSKFQFFEEFYNKALTGKNAVKEATEAKQLLYRYVRNQQLASMLKVREFAEVIRYEPARNLLKKEDGTFRVAQQLYADFSQQKEVSIKVTGFCEWLEALTAKEKNQIEPGLKQRLLKLVEKLNA